MTKTVMRAVSSASLGGSRGENWVVNEDPIEQYNNK